MNEFLSPAEVTALKREILSSLHCAMPGIVESFDPETRTAAVRPAVKYRRNAGNVILSEAEGSPRRSDVAFPVIHDVPVFMPVAFPVNPGDACLLIFADFDIDTWLESGEAEEPASGRMHSLSDAFAFIGFKKNGVVT